MESLASTRPRRFCIHRFISRAPRHFSTVELFRGTMPRLLVFDPCDNVIISKDTETISLISILSSIRFTPPPAGPPVPENAVGPMRWFIFAHWVAEEDDIGKTFEQEVKLVR